ncbi:MAG: hypothetical protein IJT96_02170 [Lachnospiraceae bacterium]|nr:hypothetical protein [Lachnospiraceae bacterium]
MSDVKIDEAEMKKLGELLKDQEYAKKLFDLETAEEVKAELDSKGISLSIDEVNELARLMNEASDKVKSNNDELTEEELESAAGGLTPIIAYTLSTTATIIYFAVKKKW